MKNFAYIEPSQEAPEGMLTVSGSEQSETSQYIRDEVYCERDGRQLSIQLLLPECPPQLTARQFQRLGRAGGPPADVDAPNPLHPLIVYLQGSAWQKQDIYRALPKLSRYVRAGYAVASVEYRESACAIWPAQICDVKTAIRFLKHNDSLFGIDKNRVAVMGDSSGGHLSLMVASTGWTDEYDDDLYPEESSAVQCCVDFYGPADLRKINDAPRTPVFGNVPSAESPEGRLIGGLDLNEHPDLAAKISPVTYIHDEYTYPPYLIMHGDEDGMVPFNQSVLMYETLVAHKKDATFYKVKGAGHGFHFYTDEVMQIAMDFLKTHLK